MHNFTYWAGHLMEQSMLGYEQVLGVFVWPLIFCGVVGYVYVKQQSLVAAAVVTLVLFSAFGNYMLGIPIFNNLMYIVTAVIITVLFLVFVTKWRNR